MRYLIDTNIFVYLHLPLISSDTRFAFYCRQGLDLVFNKK